MTTHETALRLLVCTAPAFPALAFLVLGVLRKLHVPMTERVIARTVLTALAVPFVGSVLAFVSAWFVPPPGGAWVFRVGQWLHVGDYEFTVGFYLDRLSSTMMLLTTSISLVAAQFSRTYLHREEGFPRFFILVSLFVSGMLVLVLADSYELLFFGWEIVGICSTLLIAFFRERTAPVRGGLRAFATYRFTDVGLLVAILAMHAAGVSTEHAHFTGVEATTGHVALAHAPSFFAFAMGAGLLFAAMGKSALFPLGNWLPAAMEGPTASSSLFYGGLSIHAGVYLLLRAEPVLDLSFPARVLVIAVGVLTALQGELVGRVQSDVKSRLAYAVMTQIGVVIVAVGLDMTGLALFLLASHAVLRFYQLLRAPSALRDAQVTGRLDRHPDASAVRLPAALWAIAFGRLHLDDILERYGVRPLVALALRLDRLEQLLLPSASSPSDEEAAADAEYGIPGAPQLYLAARRAPERAAVARPMGRFVVIASTFAVASMILLWAGTR